MEHKSMLRRVDWGHVAVVAAIATGISLYLSDTINASTRLGNLVFILPASILGLVLCVFVLWTVFRDASREPQADVVPVAIEPLYDRVRPLLLMVLFALYILLMPILGMDLGSAIFMFFALIANGERRMLFVVSYSLIFAAFTTLAFKWILPYPLHTLLI